MRRRILTAIVGVTALATIVLTLPLVFLMASREHNDSDRELTLVAEQVANELTSDSDFSASGLELPRIDDALITVGVYLPDGELVAGEGPTPADELTRSAGVLSSLDNVDDHRVLVRPIVEREQKVAVIRVAEPLSEAERKIWRDILVLVGIDAAALIVAAVVGSWVTSRLVRPLRAIRDDAVRLGEGDFSIVPTPSGIDELDATAGALADTAARLDGVLQRERSFTADASHQLRTPLTSLRLVIETELQSPGTDPAPVLDEALGEIDRLERTITTLLRVARDQPVTRAPLDIDQWLDTVVGRWQAVLDERGRSITGTTGVGVSPRVSLSVLDQIADILLQNAVQHGRGQVRIDVAEEADHVVITVTDEGTIARDPTELFTRRVTRAPRVTASGWRWPGHSPSRKGAGWCSPHPRRRRSGCCSPISPGRAGASGRADGTRLPDLGALHRAWGSDPLGGAGAR
ncbi:MAG: HAMP domain-containing sensor histidine kinase [Microthrixaceae bacterium]